VADTIFAEIEGEGLQFRDARYRAIMECYQANRGSVAEGEKVPEHFFIEMNDPEASCAAVDILTENDNYKQSQIWKEHDIYIDTEEERLGKIIPKSILLYKSKAIEALIEDLNKKLADMDEEAAEYMSVVEKIALFNSMRKEMAEKIQRNIL
ncbi:MAG: DNA primase, partial [Tidjanibacter sp.]|nr:DNA primase [Tidjanibacter sp.]